MISYASETEVWNERQESRIEAVGICYLRNASSVRKMDDTSHESVHNKFAIFF